MPRSPRLVGTSCGVSRLPSMGLALYCRDKMYVKKSTVRQGERTYVYLRLVEAYRDEQGKVRHRIVANLGREDELKASGQLDQLAGAFSRLDPPMAGTRRDVGALLLVDHYVRRLGLAKIVEAVAALRAAVIGRDGEQL